MRTGHPAVEISDEGLTIYGRQLGHEPCSLEVISAIPFEVSRRFLKMDNTRELLLFDEPGIDVLRELHPDLVYSVSFDFERPGWRECRPEDPFQLFRDTIRVGNITFTPPIHRKIADQASNQTFRDLTFFFTCQGQGVASLSVGFPRNEIKGRSELGSVHRADETAP